LPRWSAINSPCQAELAAHVDAAVADLDQAARALESAEAAIAQARKALAQRSVVARVLLRADTRARMHRLADVERDRAHEMRRAVAAIDAALADLEGMGDDVVAAVSIRLLSAEKESLARRLALAAPSADEPDAPPAGASEPVVEPVDAAVDAAVEVSLAPPEPPAALDEAEKPAELSVIELEVGGSQLTGDGRTHAARVQALCVDRRRLCHTNASVCGAQH